MAMSFRIEILLRSLRSDWVVVIGDVNSTAAGAIAAHRLGIPLAHVEAGLRCGDLEMAEERNRILADAYAQLLFVTEPAGVANLLHQGTPSERIHLVGNVLIDALFQILPKAEKKRWPDVVCRNAYAGQPALLSLSEAEGYALCTLHRAENVDCHAALQSLVSAIVRIGQEMPVVFPVHPRTERRLRMWGLWAPLFEAPAVVLLHPLSYSDMVCLEKNARVVLTDSGGIQEESVVLGVPCLTLRPSTERPITLQSGFNMLVSTRQPEAILEWVKHFWEAPLPAPAYPPLWDGRAAERIVRTLLAAPRPESVALPWRRSLLPQVV